MIHRYPDARTSCCMPVRGKPYILRIVSHDSTESEKCSLPGMRAESVPASCPFSESKVECCSVELHLCYMADLPSFPDETLPADGRSARGGDSTVILRIALATCGVESFMLRSGGSWAHLGGYNEWLLSCGPDSGKT